MEYEKQPDALMNGYVHIKAAPSPQVAEKVELPPLPEQPRTMMGRNIGYSADDMLEYARDAIAASRRASAPESAGQAGQVAMTTKEALQQVMREMRELSPDELRADLDRHKNGEFATALREVGDFLTERAAAPADLTAAARDGSQVHPSSALPSRTAAEWETMDHAQLDALGNAAAWRQRGE